MDKKTSLSLLPESDIAKLFINRELSALAFQYRVLEEAMDDTNPLLERIKFLAIVGSNLDEFFMVRVAGLKKQVDAGVVDLPPDGLSPAEQLAEIRKLASTLIKEALGYFKDQFNSIFKTSWNIFTRVSRADKKAKREC